MSTTPSHAELVKTAAKWLRNRRPGCGIVFTEMPTGGAHSTADAIGWTIGGRYSILIECKVSRSDFMRDMKKPHRRYACMGNERFYMVPAGLVSADELPDGWGLIEVEGRKCTITKEASHQKADRAAELCMFYSLAMRKWSHAKSEEALNEAV